MGPAQTSCPVPQGGRHPQAAGQPLFVQGAGRALAGRLGLIVPDLLLEQVLRIGGLGVGQGGQILLELPQQGIAGVGHIVLPAGIPKPRFQSRQQQADQGQPLVKGSLQQPRKSLRPGPPGQISSTP